MGDLPALLDDVRRCVFCAEHLPLGPRPVLRAHAGARLLVIGQAPGTRVHESGIPWNDRSGERLRLWLDMDEQTFYDESKVAIVPMGFCYPGVLPRGGDAPPRPECAPLWHERVLGELPAIRLTLLVGHYSQARYLGATRKKTLGATVEAFETYLADGYLPLPHPSWRTIGWEKRNPWFTERLLPRLRAELAALKL